MPFDYERLAARLSETNVSQTCVACGDDNLQFSDARYQLIEVQDDDSPSVGFGMISGMFCGARVCNTCGFVHLHATQPLGFP